MDIIKTFLKLTKKTYPHGTESQLINHLPKGYQIDDFGNYFIQIGEPNTTMFTCHLDTASHVDTKVRHVVEDGYIKTDGNSILGADDKAGMTILLYMIQNKVPGLYYFFIGEERGCIGSSALSNDFPDELKRITKCISFDRRGTDSIITHQMFGRTCSEDFARNLSNKLNEVEPSFKYSPDSTGIYTDSAQFSSIIAECTNISVGYYSEHTWYEKQDIKHLVKLCKACVKIDWESIESKRDPSVYDYGYGGYGYYEGNDSGGSYNFIEEEEEEDDCGLFNSDLNVDYQTFEDDSYFKYTIYLDLDGNGLKKYYIDEDRISYEKKLIKKELELQGYSPTRLIWDGNNCWIEEESKQLSYIGNREQLTQYIEELDKIPSEFLSRN